MQNMVTIGSKGACAKFAVRRLFFQFFFLRTATDQPVGPTDAANGSNEAS